MDSFTLKDLVIAGLIAALYTVLSLVFLPISFGVYQIRVAEALTVLPFLTEAAIPGVFVGCLLANIFGGLGWLDITIGPLLTLIAAFLTHYSGHIKSRELGFGLIFLSILLVWSVSLYLFNKESFQLKSIFLAVGALLLVSLSVWLEYFRQHSGWSTIVIKVISLFMVLGCIYLFRSNENQLIFLISSLILFGGWLMVLLVGNFLLKGRNPSLLLAPLPPVIINAFGVSLYLAPLINVDYFFSVQMIGIGQLVACYFIGLPFLMILEKRKTFFI